MVLDNNGVVVEWVRQQVPLVSDFGKCTALGLIASDGSPLAGAVYHDYRPEYKTIMISFAASTPRWATHSTVGQFLRFPFAELGVLKLRAAVAHNNLRSLKLTAGVGFTQEAVLKDEFGPGINAVMFRMFHRDYWRRYEPKAQVAA